LKTFHNNCDNPVISFVKREKYRTVILWWNREKWNPRTEECSCV